MTPSFKIVVRDSDGKSSLFSLQHEDVTTLTHAMEATKHGLPDAKTILISVPKEILNMGKVIPNEVQHA